jgi:hypothetical protein
MGFFKHQETEPSRVQKLNALEFRVGEIEALPPGSGGGAILYIDGGDAGNTGVPYIAIDGGGA